MIQLIILSIFALIILRITNIININFKIRSILQIIIYIIFLTILYFKYINLDIKENPILLVFITTAPALSFIPKTKFEKRFMRQIVKNKIIKNIKNVILK